MGHGVDRFDWFVREVTGGTLDETTIRDSFSPAFLDAVSPDQILGLAATLRPILAAAPLQRQDAGEQFHVTYDGIVASGAVEREAPHRFIGLLFQPPAPALISDDRLSDPPVTTDGAAPEAALRELFARRSLVGMVAGAFADHGARPMWRVGVGYADLEAGTPVHCDSRMLAGSIVKLCTAVGVLQLVAEGRVDLDGSANTYLRSLRLASNAPTVRQLLTHSAGVSSNFEHFVERVPPANEILGDVVELDFEPGTRWEYSNGGYTVLGEIIAGVSGVPATEFVATRVLEPLGMESSSFALAWPHDVGPGYQAVDGRAEAMPKLVPSVPAAGGLVTTTADLARFVAGWRTLLPDHLAEAAVTPQVERAGGGQGFGWLIGDDVLGHSGGTQTYSASVLWRRSDGLVTVVMTNRSAATVSMAETTNWDIRAAVDANG